MTRHIYEQIRSQLQAAFLDRPIDYKQTYYQMMDQRGATIMPPSPGVERYELTYEYSPESTVYKINVKWRDITNWLVRNIEPWQITHRSRKATLAVKPYMIHETNKKLGQLAEWLPTYSDYIQKKEVSEVLYQLVIEKTLKYLTLDYDWIATYVRQHSGSSISPKVRWSNMFQLSHAEWEDFFNTIKGFVEELGHNSGRFLNILYSVGLRARSEELDKISTEYFGEVERTRVIQFHPIMSSWNVFLPNKKEWYKEILLETERIVKASTKFHYPYVEGGNIYKIASELFSDGRIFQAMDGKNWESGVGLILGESFKPTLMYIGGYYMLGSGEAVTSLYGTMANVIVNKDVGEEMIVLGDDMNYFGKKRMRNRSLPWVENQDLDTKYKYVLGTSFVEPEKPKITGIKVMSDRGDKAIPLSLEDREGYIPVYKKRDPKEVSTWAGMYLGYYGSDTLLNRLRKVKLDELDYIAPGKIIEDLSSEVSNENPYEWAETEGVKNLIVV